MQSTVSCTQYCKTMQYDYHQKIKTGMTYDDTESRMTLSKRLLVILLLYFNRSCKPMNILCSSGILSKHQHSQVEAKSAYTAPTKQSVFHDDIQVHSVFQFCREQINSIKFLRTDILLVTFQLRSTRLTKFTHS